MFEKLKRILGVPEAPHFSSAPPPKIDRVVEPAKFVRGSAVNADPEAYEFWRVDIDGELWFRRIDSIEDSSYPNSDSFDDELEIDEFEDDDDE